MELKTFIIWIIIAFFVWLILWFLIMLKWRKKKHKETLKKQNAIINWNITERLAPFTMWYNPNDMYFLWNWIDYIVFDWLRKKKLKQIVLLEIKTWTSRLNADEKAIKEAVNAGKVVYKEERFNLDELKKLFKQK